MISLSGPTYVFSWHNGHTFQIYALCNIKLWDIFNFLGNSFGYKIIVMFSSKCKWWNQVKEIGHLSASLILLEISVDSRLICRPSLGRYLGRYIDPYIGGGVHKIRMILYICIPYIYLTVIIIILWNQGE